MSRKARKATEHDPESFAAALVVVAAWEAVRGSDAPRDPSWTPSSDDLLEALRAAAEVESTVSALTDWLMVTAADPDRGGLSVRQIRDAINARSEGTISYRLSRIRAGRPPIGPRGRS